jgi:hypothetical protein
LFLLDLPKSERPNIVWARPIVMTFLVRECYGSPKKHENSLKFVKICDEECFDKVLNEEFKKTLM